MHNFTDKGHQGIVRTKDIMPPSTPCAALQGYRPSDNMNAASQTPQRGRGGATQRHKGVTMKEELKKPGFTRRCYSTYSGRRGAEGVF